jgi:hypothetical protein
LTEVVLVCAAPLSHLCVMAGGNIAKFSAWGSGRLEANRTRPFPWLSGPSTQPAFRKSTRVKTACRVRAADGTLLSGHGHNETPLPRVVACVGIPYTAMLHD